MPETPQPAPLPPGTRPDPAADPRDAEVEAAAAEFMAWLKPWAERHRVTGLEFSYILSVANVRQVQALCKMEREATRRGMAN